MQNATAYFNRPDTLLGVCEAIGQDFGFNPLFLRIAFAASLLWNPVAVISLYVALGAAVALSRLLVPVAPRARRSAEEKDRLTDRAQVASDEEEEEEEDAVAIAA